MNPDGIGTTIFHPDAIRSYVLQAADRDIPVIAFNVPDAQDPDPTLPALLYIGSDEFFSGVSNARRVFAQAQADGITLQRGVCTFQSGTLLSGIPGRCAGVKSVFDEAGVPLDQLPLTIGSTGHSDVIDLAVNQIADYFKAHPETHAIFMFAPSPTSALHQYIQQAGLKPRQLYATTHDTSPEIFQMIRDGYLLQTIDQQPYMQGFQTIISLYLYRQYGLRPSGFINTSSVVDKSNVDFVTRLVDAGYR
jgi:simple sugar transport system substrate-binding protein